MLYASKRCTDSSAPVRKFSNLFDPQKRNDTI